MATLPPALAARLAKRGLIKNNNSETLAETTIDQHEEVIAEDYDDTPKLEIMECKIIDTVIGCPNKYNIYHNCTSYCSKKYSDVSLEASKKVKRKFARLLKKYPLKDGNWEQIYEPGLQTYYFWNTETDQVSWLPSSHPNAKISMSAEKLRRLIRDDHNESDSEKSVSDNEKNSDNEDESGSELESDSSSSSSLSSENEAVSVAAKRIKMIHKSNKLDPMDPAAYSKIPKGKWSDGLI